MSVPGLAAPALAGLGARAARFAALAALGLLLLVLLAVLAVFGSEYERRHPRVQESPGSGIPPVYLPVYAAAEHAYGVNRWLLASIHLQESDFSRLRARSLVGDAVSSGWNGCGAAGPMQMGIVGVAPYGATTAGGCSAGPTWAAYRRAFARAARERPARYPQRARRASRVRARARARRLRLRRLRRDPRRGAEAARRRREPQPRCGRHPARGVRVHRLVPGRRHLLRRAAARQGLGGGGAGRPPAAGDRRCRARPG